MKIIELSGYVGWQITARILKEQLPGDKSDVLIKVDSFGGSVYEGNRLFNTISDYEGNIFIELGAVAASAASYFPLGVPVERISVRDNTTFMAHKAWAFMLGNADELRSEAQILDGFDRIIAKTYANLTHRQTADEYLTGMGKEIWLIGGQAVVNAGFASKIVPGSALAESEETEIIEQSVILAKIEEGKNKLKELDIKEDLEKWAASINEQLVIKKQSAPLNAEGNILKGDFKNMKLDEILNADPEAKAEYNNKILSAVNEGKKTSFDQAVNDERTRISKIINLSGFILPDTLKDSIESGESLDIFMEKEIQVRNLKLKKPENNVDIGDLETGSQTPEGEEAEQGQTKMDAAINRRLGKKNKEDVK